MWPPPRIAVVTFGTSPADVIPEGPKKVPKGIEALKFLFSITPASTPVSTLADHPFKFLSPWHSRSPVSVMTANVHSARLLAAAQPIATYWATSAKHAFGSKEMMIALQHATRLHELVNHTNATVPGDLLPFACTPELHKLGRVTMLLCLCSHAKFEEQESLNVVATAAHVWKVLSDLVISDRQWERYRQALVAKAKQTIADHYATHVVQSQWKPNKILVHEKGDTLTHEAVFDALSCNPSTSVIETLATQWSVYRRMGTPAQTPVATWLRDDIPPECNGTPISLPRLTANEAWLRSL